MATPDSNPYLYFLYSVEHINMRNEIEGALGRKFDCGTIVVNGKKKKYSYVSTSKDAFLKNYPDAKLIAEGYTKNLNFTECSSSVRRG